MSRRQLTVLVASLAVATLSACSDTTAPLAPDGSRQLKAGSATTIDASRPDVCRGGYMTSTGKAC